MTFLQKCLFTEITRICNIYVRIVPLKRGTTYLPHNDVTVPALCDVIYGPLMRNGRHEDQHFNLMILIDVFVG